MYLATFVERGAHNLDSHPAHIKSHGIYASLPAPLLVLDDDRRHTKPCAAVALEHDGHETGSIVCIASAIS